MAPMTVRAACSHSHNSGRQSVKQKALPMRTLLATLTCILGFLVAATPIVDAQSSVDIPSIEQKVMGVSPDALVAALHTPMPNEDLPQQFSGATYVEPTSPRAGTESVIGSVTYTLTYEPTPGGTPSSQASPRASGPERIFNLASVQYLIFEHQLDAAALEHFDDVLRSTIGDQAVNADVETISIQGRTAYRISIETETNGIPIVIEWVAIPVGLVAVVGMTMTSGETIDIVALQADAEALTVAGVGHLGSAVEHHSAPAG